MEATFQCKGITVSKLLRNISVKELYSEAAENEVGSVVSSTQALMVRSGEKTGRSPKDKRVVKESTSEKDIWWGDVNIAFTAESFTLHKKHAVDFLNTQKKLYVVDGFAGWAPEYQVKVRIICTRPYHALFMHNMLIRPTAAELKNFGEPDYVIYNAGVAKADKNIPGITSNTCVALNFASKEMVIVGTEYAGEMKKGVFTIMNYIMPKKNVLSMHCSANVGDKNDVTLFFGLSGTGKTTLSAESHRKLIGDDEHCWSNSNVFNIEGGCYAKCIDLSAEKEPEIFNAIKYGTVLENVVYDSATKVVNYADKSITENTRASYPIDYIPNIQMPCVGPKPKNVIFLTCDAFGVLPPVSKLTPAQAMYHFMSGYTAKVAGTEMGVTEPEATFSACFGAAFMVWHPSKYAELLSMKIKENNVDVWLINTGWSGGAYGVGKRMSLKHTRSIIDAIHDGTLKSEKFSTDPIFGLSYPEACTNVPSDILNPKNTWADKNAYDLKAKHLAKLFHTNFKKYEAGSSAEICQAGPKI